MRTIILAVCLIFFTGAGAALAQAEIITPEGPFSGTYENAPEPQTEFYIALIDPAGNCQTIQVNARNLDQAIHFAQDFCPDCIASDVTGEYKPGYFSSGQPPEQYCPLR